jgi:phosphoserine phosphatase RsbU/P
MREQDLSVVLTAFYDATRCPAALWMQTDPARPIHLLAVAPPSRAVTPPAAALLPRGPEPHTLAGPEGRQLAARIPPAKHVWLVLGPSPSGGLPLSNLFRFLAPVVSQILQTAMEVEHAASELAERYEEINLLYTISEILGRTVRLEEAAATILPKRSARAGPRFWCTIASRIPCRSSLRWAFRPKTRRRLPSTIRPVCRRGCFARNTP